MTDNDPTTSDTRASGWEPGSEGLAEVGRQMATLGEQLASAVNDVIDRLSRTVSLLLPKPDEVAGDVAVWSGDGWRVELAGDQIAITGGCEHGETTAVAAAMIAADRRRAHNQTKQEWA